MTGAVRINKRLLRTMALPAHDGDVDKDARGRVLVVGGCVAMPGALLLSGVGALRAGAGKLQMMTCTSVAPLLALAIPEALVAGVDELDGAISATAAGALLPRVTHSDAVLLGPGMASGPGTEGLTAAVLGLDPGAPALVLDAAALSALPSLKALMLARHGRTVLTPHGGEMATLMDIGRDEVLVEPEAVAQRAAARFGAIVALKGPNTIVATPDGQLFRFAGGGVGLATSGSGDTLAGIVCGLLARGASPLAATIWAVYVHGKAGKRLGRRIGRVGFLARELLAEVPRVIARVEEA
ncbi:NAD(P)H-hydrate dehydratase [Polymorphobacter sp.]|uniref:NAD(P)H-hydrate dehydratase n=1 Tax=Polymorphobacter sp. TaxID=1909290 RepID=UPI003F6F9136